MSFARHLLVAVMKELIAVRPLLPTYLHLIVSAVFPIYAGAHASLTRPTSAAKPAKRPQCEQKDENNDDQESRMEGLSPSDAIVFPVLAGCTLGGLYLIIKWLEDPALLNKILNWYFAAFGVFGLTKMVYDVSEVLTSFTFPKQYSLDGELWVFDTKRRLAVCQPDSSRTRDSPLAGRLATLPLPAKFLELLWLPRIWPPSLCVRTKVSSLSSKHFDFSVSAVMSFALAVTVVLYYNLVYQSWWLTNLLGFSFAYNALQFISPTTSWTGTLVLGALFLYDIYFVFFTPLMVTVATKLDIPAKLLFPRPKGADEDPSTQSLSMLGLGDVVLPGMMIGFALRFDLYLFYLRKQSESAMSENKTTLTGVAVEPSKGEKLNDTDVHLGKHNGVVKAPWTPATGNWGERFWTNFASVSPNITEAMGPGGLFPKVYFHASLIGYVIGMILTLGSMHLSGHAQPALLYLVPCVLVAYWGTAFFRGETHLLWSYDESSDDSGTKEEDKSIKAGGIKEGDPSDIAKAASQDSEEDVFSASIEIRLGHGVKR